MTGLYNIPLFSLSEGHQTFDFKIGNKFFADFKESEIREGELVAVAGIVKSRVCIDLTIRITGSVRICCDRCLDMYSQLVECENHILIRQGEYWDDSDPEILIVPHNEKELDISQLLYEYIHLSLPLRRIHPDDKEGYCGCDPEMIKELKKHVVKRNEAGDSIWTDLKKILNNN